MATIPRWGTGRNPKREVHDVQMGVRRLDRAQRDPQKLSESLQDRRRPGRLTTTNPLEEPMRKMDYG